MIIIWILLYLLHVLSSSDAAFKWANYSTSVRIGQGQTAYFNWTVDIGNTSSLAAVGIAMNATGVIGYTPTKNVTKEDEHARTPNMDFAVQEKSNVVKIFFTFRNLILSDKVLYEIQVIRSDATTSTKSFFIDVLDVPYKLVPQHQPNKFEFCRNDTINITCSALVGNPNATNFTFFQNGAKFDYKVGTLNGNKSRAVVISKVLSELGDFIFSCQAANRLGSSLRFSINTITVKDRPVITNCTNKTVEEGKPLSWTCDATGSEPLTFSWYKGSDNKVIHSGKTYAKAYTRADAGMYRVTVSNGEGCLASKTVYLDVQSLDTQACRANGYTLVTSSGCLSNVSITANGHPKPTLTCDAHNFTNAGNNYTICGGEKVDKAGSKCFISNAIRSCDFKVKVLPRVLNNIKIKCSMIITNKDFKEIYSNKDSAEFKELKKSLEDKLYSAYRYDKYVIMITVEEFFPGSVIVNFELTMSANVSDPLSPLREELNRTQNLLGGQYLVNSPRLGSYVPPTTPTKEPSRSLSTGAIVGIAIGCAVVLIVVIVLLVYCCYCKKRSNSTDDKRKTVEDGDGMQLKEKPSASTAANTADDRYSKKPITGVDNKGLSGTKASK